MSLPEHCRSITAYERFAPWRRRFEIGFWVVLLIVETLANGLTALMDVRRAHLRAESWEPFVWEISSSLLWAVVIPGIVVFSRRYPLYWDTWRRNLPWHLLASLVVSLVHVAGMVGLRMAAYRSVGLHYDFGSWPREFGYEYLKDLRSYAGLVFTIEAYRLLLRRLQGEVHLLDLPDEGPPAEPVERPERFLVRKLGREFLVAAADIDWLQASGNYVNLRVRGHDYPLRSTIAGVESKLDPERFVRIHRSYIANLTLIRSIKPLDTGDAQVQLADGSVLPCSRRYRAALRERIAGEA